MDRDAEEEEGEKEEEEVEEKAEEEEVEEKGEAEEEEEEAEAEEEEKAEKEKAGTGNPRYCMCRRTTTQTYCSLLKLHVRSRITCFFLKSKVLNIYKKSFLSELLNPV